MSVERATLRLAVGFQACTKRLCLPPQTVNLAVKFAVDFVEKPFEKATLLGAIEDGFARLQQTGRRRARAPKGRRQALSRHGPTLAG